MDSKMKEYIYSKYKETFRGISRFSITWLENFVDFLINHNVNEEQTKEIIQKLLGPENLENMAKSDFNIAPFIYNERDFFSYLASIEDELTPEYCEQAYDYILKHASEGNVIDSFIKYLVITRFDDIQVKSDVAKLKENPDGEYMICCCLGDFKICRVSVSIDNANANNIFFDELHTRRNLTGAKVGSVLFQTLFSEIHEHFPNNDLVTRRVRKRNVGGQRFYERMGGTFFDVSTGDVISPSEVDTSAIGNIGVYYDKEDLLELSQREITRPTLEDKVNKRKNTK